MKQVKRIMEPRKEEENCLGKRSGQARKLTRRHLAGRRGLFDGDRIKDHHLTLAEKRQACKEA